MHNIMRFLAGAILKIIQKIAIAEHPSGGFFQIQGGPASHKNCGH